MTSTVGPYLLRDILTRGIAPVSDGQFAIKTTKHFLGMIEKAVPFVADNVAWWWKREKNGVVRDSDMPCIVPPYPYTWVEYPELWAEGIDRSGVLFCTEDFGAEDDPSAAVADRIASFTQLGKIMKPSGEIEERRLAFVGPARWVVYGLPVMRAVGKGPVGPVKAWFGALDPSGGMARDADGAACCGSQHGLASLEVIQAFETVMTEALLTMAFLNCRNVTQEERLPSRQERRAADRRGEAVLKYRTLVIDPMRKALETEGGLRTNGIARALHICRGHFSTYSEEKPLFGKYAGRFWIPAHVRGTSEAGAVVKDYSVKPSAA